MYSLKHIGMVIFTVAMMIGTYLLIKDLTDFATPLAVVILFIDEAILLFLGMIGWRVDQLIDRIKR